MVEKAGREGGRGEGGQEISCVTGFGTCLGGDTSLFTRDKSDSLGHTRDTKPSQRVKTNKTEAPRRYALELRYYFMIANHMIRAKHPPYSQKDSHPTDTPLLAQDLLGNEWV